MTARILRPGEHIYRYEVPVDDRWWHTLELWGDPIHVGGRVLDVVEFWARWSPQETDGWTALGKREFAVVGTGHLLPEGTSRYWGTVVHPAHVWHLIERDPTAGASPRSLT